MSKYLLFTLRAIAVGFLLLAPTVTKAELAHGVKGCPCLTLEEKEEMSLGLIGGSILASSSNKLESGNASEEEVAAHGVGCGLHKNLGDLQQNNQWCYVNPRKCNLNHSPSNLFHGLFFSNAACGDPDEYVRNTLRLKSVDLRMVIHNNNRGYQGTICPSFKNASFGKCEGTLVDLALAFMARDELNITYEFVEVPQWVTERAESYAPFVEATENMTHGACVYATSMGAVDICLGAFTKNLNRALISPFLEMGVTSEYLIVFKQSNDEDLNTLIQRIFSPFSASLWIVTFVVLIILSLLFLIQEHSWLELKETALDKTFGLAVYNAGLGFFAAGRETDKEPLSWGGRFTLLAIAVQILLSTASYTANLTNFLVRDVYSTDVENIDDAIQQGLEVCVLRNKISILNTAYGENTIKYAKGPVNGTKLENGTLANETLVPGFSSREELLDSMDNDKCFCAILGMEDLSESQGKGRHCNKKLVGTPVIELPWGIPVSEEFAPPLRTIMTEYMNDGKWNQIQKDAKPPNLCLEKEIDGEETKLEVRHMAGAYVLSGVLAAIGIVCSLARFANRKRKKLVGKKVPSPQNDAKIGSEDSEEFAHPSSREENRNLHAAMANIASEISELKQLVAFGRETRMP